MEHHFEGGAEGTLSPHDDRRGFLAKVSAAGAAVSAALVGFPVVRSFISPSLPQPRADGWVKVADDIALHRCRRARPGELRAGPAGRVGREPHAERRVALHRGRREVQGVQRALHASRLQLRATTRTSRHFFCPCHRGQFDVKTGDVLGGPPPRPLDELQVEVRDSAVYVNYQDFRLGVAETDRGLAP